MDFSVEMGQPIAQISMPRKHALHIKDIDKNSMKALRMAYEL
jgi:hypothetical protein